MARKGQIPAFAGSARLRAGRWVHNYWGVGMGSTTRGERRRRNATRTAAAVAVVVGLAAPLALPTAALAHSVPQPGDGSTLADAAVSPEVAQAKLLQRRVRQRERALTSITRQAVRYADVKRDEVARLAALGYTGDLADLTHVLPLAGYYLSAGYGLAGPHWEHSHTGQDFAATPACSLVRRGGDGVITSVADSGAYGLRTILTLEDGTEILVLPPAADPGRTRDAVHVGDALGLARRATAPAPTCTSRSARSASARSTRCPRLQALGLTP